MAPSMGKAISGGPICHGSGGDLAREVFPEPSLPLSQVLWDPFPFIIIWLGTYMQKESYMCLKCQYTNHRDSSSGHSLEGTKFYLPKLVELHPMITAIEMGKGNEEEGGVV